MSILHSNLRSPLSHCRIAIVDSQPRLHGRLAALLHHQEWARGFLSLESLIDRADASPTVIVIGPSLMDLPSLETVMHFMRQRADVAVVLTVMNPTRKLLEWSSSAGVSDVIDLASEADQLADAVDAAATALLAIDRPVDLVDSMEELTSAEIITVFSTKGGTGKSVVASNLAVKLAGRSDRPVVLVDADFQFGDLAVMMKLQPEHSLADAIALIDRLDVTMLESLLTWHEASGVYLLASPAMPTVGNLISAHHMQRILDVLRQFAGHVVIDTQSYMDEATLAILHNSTEIVLVGNMDIPSMKDMKMGLSLLRSLKVPLENSRLIMNRTNPKLSLDLKAIERSLHHRVDATIREDAMIPQSINHRIPAVMQEADGALSKSMDGIIDLLQIAI